MVFNVTEDTYCVTLPPMMGSRGIGIPGYLRDGVMQYGLPQFFLQFIIIFVLNQFLSYMLTPIGFTQFASQLLGGILLGPLCIGRSIHIRRLIFPKFYDMKSHSEEYLNAETVFALSFYIFIVAVKMDMGLLFRVGNKCWSIGVSSILTPLVVVGLGLLWKENTNNMVDNTRRELIVILIQQSLTAFPVISWLLQDLKLLNTELGRLALSSSLITDIIGIFLFGSLSSYNRDIGIRMSLEMVAFSMGVMFIIRPGMLWVARKTPSGQPVKGFYLNLLVILVLLSGVVSNWMGQFFFFGPFILGLAVPEGPPLGSAIVGKMETFFQGILLPLYVTSTVASINLNALFDGHGDISMELILIIGVIAVKMVACLAPPLVCKLPFKDSMALALILNCKGVIELAAYKILYDTKRLNEKRLSLVVVDIILSAILLPLLLRKLYPCSTKYGGYQQRNLLNLREDAEIPLLSCIHRADHITASVNLVDMLYPTKESPLKIYVLHLTKLIGQSTPELIAHQKRDGKEGKSMSDSVILAFTNYMCTKAGSVLLNLFTVMSPPKMFPDYVCHLALDKLVSLIVLPFHKRWSKDGLIEHEDTNIEALNNIVLETAPCSVGILIHRGNLCHPPCRRSQDPLHVGLFFLGGNDDREAVVLARRMARDPTTQLTVVHLCVKEEVQGVVSWEKMMDEEVLNDNINGAKCEDNIRYVRDFVEDGPQTAWIVRSMADQFNLIIVGRNHEKELTQTSGLREWVELPELGVLGDILASTDFTSTTSTLIIQQQKINNK